MKRQLVLLASYFITTPLIIFGLIIYTLFLLHNNSSFSETHNVFSKSVEYKAIPAEIQQSSIEFSGEDGRVKVLNEFFTKYKSPLLPYSQLIVETADKYGLDYRLVPSIAMQESNVCHRIPKDSYNCWGFGIYDGKITRFEGYEEAIETVSKGLSKNYKDKGLNEPHEIMTKYTPGSDGSWADSVNFFMDKLGASL